MLPHPTQMKKNQQRLTVVGPPIAAADVCYVVGVVKVRSTAVMDKRICELLGLELSWQNVLGAAAVR